MDDINNEIQNEKSSIIVDSHFFFLWIIYSFIILLFKLKL